MSDSTNLQLPYLEGAQAQKHVTVNEALRKMDALVFLAVEDKDLTAPPGSPADGARYIPSPTATGVWSGKENYVAHYVDGAWEFYSPREGWQAYVKDEDILYCYSGSAWVSILTAGLDADLQAIAALTPSNNDFLQRKSGAWTYRTPTQVAADLGAVLPDGAVGAPGFAFASDSDTGLWRCGANIIAASVGGTEVWRASAALLTVTGAITATGCIAGAQLATSGNLSAASWTSSGLRLVAAAATLTNSSSSGTVATLYADAFKAATLAASSATTYTNAYGCFFEEPIAGTNVTLSNKYALGAASANFTGAVKGTTAIWSSTATATAFIPTSTTTTGYGLAASSTPAIYAGGTEVWRATSSSITVNVPLSIVKSVAGGLNFIVNNTNSGNAYTSMTARNDVNHDVAFQVTGSGYTPSGVFRADGAILYSQGAGGVTIVTGSGYGAPIYFAVGEVEQLQLAAAGGLVVGAATGGGKGIGTVNIAGDLYKNNTAYTNPDYVFERWATGAIVRYAANDGAASYGGLMTLGETERFVRENWHLPRFGEAARHGLFGGADALLATVEETYLHLFDHENRLANLERRLAA